MIPLRQLNNSAGDVQMTADGLDDDEYTDVSLNSRINRKLRKLTFLNLGLLFLQIMMIILLVVVFVVSARYIREFEKSINVAEINKSMITLRFTNIGTLN